MSEQASKAPASAASFVNSTVAAYRFLVAAKITKREIMAKADKPARTMYMQQCVVIGGTRQLNSEISAFEEGQTLSAGCYVLSNDCLKVNQYGRLELAARGENLQFVREMTKDELAFFDATTTDASDLFPGRKVA